jgi:hypothetical protein
MKNTLALSAAAIALLLAPVARADAATVILANPDVASAVNDLIVDGKTYDVQFVLNGTDTTFVGNDTGALAAANALDAALNGSTAAFVHMIGDGSVTSFVVQDNGTEGVFSLSGGNAHHWQICCTSPDESVAVFAAVPEPSTWAMMLLGFAGLGLAGWRSRRRSVAIAG